MALLSANQKPTMDRNLDLIYPDIRARNTSTESSNMKNRKRFATWTTAILSCTFMCGCDLADAASDGLYTGVSELISRIIIAIFTGQPLA